MHLQCSLAMSAKSIFCCIYFKDALQGPRNGSIEFLLFIYFKFEGLIAQKLHAAMSINCMCFFNYIFTVVKMTRIEGLLASSTKNMLGLSAL